MKGLCWFNLGAALLILAVPFAFPERVGSDLAPFSVALVVCSSLCFLGSLAFLSWCRWLEFQKEKQNTDQAKTAENTLAEKEKQIAELKRQLNEAESRSRTQVQDLLQLAEKLRTKTTHQTEKDKLTMQTTDEVPAEIRKLIIENFPKS